jgi:hypothetical protein
MENEVRNASFWRIDFNVHLCFKWSKQSGKRIQREMMRASKPPRPLNHPLIYIYVFGQHGAGFEGTAFPKYVLHVVPTTRELSENSKVLVRLLAKGQPLELNTSLLTQQWLKRNCNRRDSALRHFFFIMKV